MDIEAELADWLEEHGRPGEAMTIRWHLLHEPFLPSLRHRMCSKWIKGHLPNCPPPEADPMATTEQAPRARDTMSNLRPIDPAAFAAELRRRAEEIENQVTAFAAELRRRAEEIENQVKALEEAKIVTQETMQIEVSI